MTMARALYTGVGMVVMVTPGQPREVQIDCLTVIAPSPAHAQRWAIEKILKKWPPGLGFVDHRAQMFEMTRETVAGWLAAYDEVG